MFWVGIDRWLKTTISHHVYQNPADKQEGIVSEIAVPFYKVSHVCYQDILLLCKLRIEDYSWSIGPYPCPLTWVSFMESTFELRFALMFVICCFDAG